jgi:phosphate transport system permease protein
VTAEAQRQAAFDPLRRRRHGLARSGDVVFRRALLGVASLVLVVLGWMLADTTRVAWPLLRAELVASERWFPGGGHFGALALVYGTVVTSLVALALAVPVSLGIALALNELVPRRARTALTYLVDLLAAIPSVVYGLWAVLVLLPVLGNDVYPRIADALGSIPLLSGPAFGRSFATAGIVLAIMIVPIVAAIAREVIALVPREQREAALALGATRWETIRLAVFPHARAGIVGGVMLGFGRALGETIAVALVIGGSPQVAASLFQPGSTIASTIASQFNEATGDHIRALVAIGVLLFLVTVVVNAVGRGFVWRASRGLAR